MNGWTISQCEEQIKKLQDKATAKIKNLANMTYNEVYDFVHVYSRTLEELKRKVIGLKAAETRRANKKLEAEVRQAAEDREHARAKAT